MSSLGNDPERPQDHPRSEDRPQDFPRPQDRPQDFPRYADGPHQQQAASQPSGLQPYPPVVPYPPYGQGRQDHANATVALVLGVVPLVTGILLISPFAWWLGKRSLTEIDAAPDRYGNRGMAMAGYIMGIVGTILLVLGILLVGGIVIIAFWATDNYSTP